VPQLKVLIKEAAIIVPDLQGSLKEALIPVAFIRIIQKITSLAISLNLGINCAISLIILVTKPFLLLTFTFEFITQFSTIQS
jgi:hypothetical protein